MLVAFDFDGTLSDAELSMLLAEEKGVAREVAGIVTRATNGDVDYAESLRDRADLLEGLPEEQAHAAFNRSRLRPGAAEMLSDLRDDGHHVAIITGGFERGVRAALDDAGVDVDTLVANRLPTENGALTGDVEGELLDRGKDDVLEEIAVEQDVPLAETIAVGDGSSDLPMLQTATEGIGFRPAPIVRQEADTVLASIQNLHLRLAEHDIA
ncbi:phosphoserine phosphatase SerB [Halobaculum sp. D14]|uniref:phosphoserine phosphatase SerB n=1 Tax=unclassified Halobaculum TaxID=2640896 RepID=UPI003EBE105B